MALNTKLEDSKFLIAFLEIYIDSSVSYAVSVE